MIIWRIEVSYYDFLSRIQWPPGDVMIMDDATLEKFYREELDERLIMQLAKEKDLSLEKAMDIYYHSQMAEMIGNGECGIQYLDYKVLVQMMLDTEPELFEK